MLLNEFLKQHWAFLEEHRKVEEQGREAQGQQATIAELKSTVARQQKEMETVVARLKEQAEQIQIVSAQVEMSKFDITRIRRGGPAPRMVLNP
jgi:septal ring factor EnvC (AmiA/AmiB activator)